MIVAGIDEAGYGPMLGPLVVSMTAFRARTKREDPHDLWSALGDACVVRSPVGLEKRDERLVVCDSKKLHQGGKGARRMEETALSFLSLALEAEAATDAAAPIACKVSPDAALGTTLEALLPALGLDRATVIAYPWYERLEERLPVHTFRSTLERQSARLRKSLADAGLEPLLVRPVAVHPREFNRGAAAEGNKHLFEWTIVARHLRLLWDRHGEEGVSVVCDKLGGRSFYGPHLAALFPGARVTAPEQGAEGSYYKVIQGKRRLSVAFLAEGDDKAFCVSLASCCAKYVREVFLRPLNAFFADRVPGLKPTAGYVQDGRRFLEEIRPAWDALGADEALLVRAT